MFNLKGSFALITGVGAKNGIGFHAASTLLAMECSLIITSTTDRIFERQSELELLAQARFGTQAPRVIAHKADLIDTQEVEQLVSGIEQLDILVNNAGMSSLIQPLAENEQIDLVQLTDEAWSQGISRNLDTAFKVTRESLPLIRNSLNGRIIFVSSVTGGLMAMRQQPAYASSKAALIGLMRSVAIDEGVHGITANAVLPGWIETDTQTNQEANQGKRSALGRSGKPAEVASTIAWLASKEAGYITGQAIVVDGGNSIAEERA
jgi:3-oxoacyl-[acyl-carrier protein] reductase